MTSQSRFALLACIFLASLTASLPNDAFAQDAIFGDEPGLFGAEPTPGEAATDDSESEDPLVRQLLELSSRGNMELASAIASLIRLEQWKEVERLLARTAGKNIDNASLAAMYRTIGPTNYLRVKQRTDLSGSAQAGIDKIQVAATNYSQSADRLRAAIDQLGSSPTDDRLAATRTLLDGGDAAVKELVEAAVKEQPNEKRDQILRTMLALGDGGVDALRQLALYSEPEIRARALTALGRVSVREHVADLVTGLYASDAVESEREAAREQLLSLDGVPTREASIEALAFDLRSAHDIARRTQNDGQRLTIWSLTPDRSGVDHQSALTLHATYREVYDAAARLHRIGNLTPELNTAVLAAAMGYHLIIDPDWGDDEQVQPIRDTYRSAVTGTALSKVVGYTLDSGDHAATLGLIRLINPANATESQVHELLDGEGGLAAPLVRASFSPEPRVRYEAALKVKELAGDMRYAGSSQVMRTLSEMVSLDDRPTVILVETRSEVILPIETFLRGLGLRVEVASTVGEVQRCVARGGDLRLLLAKNNLWDLPAVEMVDSVRRMNRGRELPVVVYGDNVPYLGAQRWSATTTSIEGSVSMSSLDELFDIVRRSRRMPALTILDRQQYRAAASDLLGI